MFTVFESFMDMKNKVFRKESNHLTLAGLEVWKCINLIVTYVENELQAL